MQGFLLACILCAGLSLAQTAIEITDSSVTVNVSATAGQYFFYNPAGYQSLITVREVSRSPAPSSAQDPCAYIWVRPGYPPKQDRQGYSQAFPQTPASQQINRPAISCNWYIYVTPIQAAVKPGYTTPSSCTVIIGKASQVPLKGGSDLGLCEIETEYEQGTLSTTAAPITPTTQIPTSTSLNSASSIAYACAVWISCLIAVIIAQ